MARTVLTPLRLPPNLVEWADRLVPLVANDLKVATIGRVTRSSVLRMALVRGLESLDKQYIIQDAGGCWTLQSRDGTKKTTCRILRDAKAYLEDI